MTQTPFGLRRFTQPSILVKEGLCPKICLAPSKFGLSRLKFFGFLIRRRRTDMDRMLCLVYVCFCYHTEGKHGIFTLHIISSSSQCKPKCFVSLSKQAIFCVALQTVS